MAEKIENLRHWKVVKERNIIPGDFNFRRVDSRLRKTIQDKIQASSELGSSCEPSFMVSRLLTIQMLQGKMLLLYLNSFTLISECFWDRISLCSLDWSRNCYVIQDGLKLTEIHHLWLSSAEIKCVYHHIQAP